MYLRYSYHFACSGARLLGVYDVIALTPFSHHNLLPLNCVVICEAVSRKPNIYAFKFMLVHCPSHVLGIAILLINWWLFLHWNNIRSVHRNRCPFHLTGPQTILLESFDKAFSCHPCLEVRSYFSVFHNIRGIDTCQIREGKPFARKRWESFFVSVIFKIPYLGKCWSMRATAHWRSSIEFQN